MNEACSVWPERPDTGMTVGTLSGTSADGIDIALIRVRGHRENAQVELIEFCTLPYPPYVTERLLEVFKGTASCPGAVARLHADLGEVFGRSIRLFLDGLGLCSRQVLAVGSHGQTVYHEPPPGSGVTLQLGDPARIAAQTGIAVVADFRSMDMALGGQGAPLIPYFDWVRLTREHMTRCALNLGGIGNLTYLPAAAEVSEVKAFDTGPGNMVLDAVVRRLSGGKMKYDSDGKMALSGRPAPDAVAKLMKHPFLHEEPPRSAGRLEFGQKFTDQLWDLNAATPWGGIAREMNGADLMATLATWTATCAVQAVENISWAGSEVDQIIVGGGGAHNEAVMQHLRRLASAEVLTYPQMGDPVMGEAREAVAFAFYAWEFLGRQPVNIPQVTGASAEAVLGSFTLPQRSDDEPSLA